MSHPIRVRFAPSPTGLLHLGNARTALMNWLFARNQGGDFVLRIDDTDRERSKAVYQEAIEEDLRWLGMQWDETFCQSSKTDTYASFIHTLKDAGHLYACYETPQDLENMRQELLAQGKPPLYRRKATEPLARNQEAPHWRFALHPREVVWQDAIQGAIAYHTAHISDPVVVRQDGMISYLLASVIDDATTHISHILRGADHITNTALQIAFFQTLGYEPPIFGHFPLISSASGNKLSKRASSSTIKDLRQQGYLPLAICQGLASLGCSPFHTGSLQEMAQGFALSCYNNKAVRMADDHMDRFNQDLLRSLSWQEVQALDHPAVREVTPHIWSVIAPNITTLQEVEVWMKILNGKKDPSLSPMSEQDRLLAQRALATLPATPWNEHTWSQWLETLVEQAREKKGILARGLRRILTGKDNGPRMDLILPLMGMDHVQTYLAI